MNIDPNGWFSKYLYPTYGPPYYNTTLCAVAWKFLWQTLLYSSGVFLVWVICYIQYTNYMSYGLWHVVKDWLGFFTVLGVWVVSGLVMKYLIKRRYYYYDPNREPSTVVQVYRAVKDRYCPIVTFKVPE